MGDRSVETVVVGRGRPGEPFDLCATEATGCDGSVGRIVWKKGGKEVAQGFGDRGECPSHVEYEAGGSLDRLVHHFRDALRGVRVDPGDPAAFEVGSSHGQPSGDYRVRAKGATTAAGRARPCDQHRGCSHTPFGSLGRSRCGRCLRTSRPRERVRARPGRDRPRWGARVGGGGARRVLPASRGRSAREGAESPVERVEARLYPQSSRCRSILGQVKGRTMGRISPRRQGLGLGELQERGAGDPPVMADPGEHVGSGRRLVRAADRDDLALRSVDSDQVDAIGLQHFILLAWFAGGRRADPASARSPRRSPAFSRAPSRVVCAEFASWRNLLVLFRQGRKRRSDSIPRGPLHLSAQRSRPDFTGLTIAANGPPYAAPPTERSWKSRDPLPHPQPGGNRMRVRTEIPESDRSSRVSSPDAHSANFWATARNGARGTDEGN